MTRGGVRREGGDLLVGLIFEGGEGEGEGEREDGA